MKIIVYGPAQLKFPSLNLRHGGHIKTMQDIKNAQYAAVMKLSRNMLEKGFNFLYN